METNPFDTCAVEDLFSRDPEDLLSNPLILERIVKYYEENVQRFLDSRAKRKSPKIP